MAKKQKPTNNDRAPKGNAEMKHYLGAMSEHFEGKLDVVIEHFKDINAKLDTHTDKLGEHTVILGEHTVILGEHTVILDMITTKLGVHTEMIGGIAQDVEIIKADIEFLKGGMKKKVDYDEFLALERRLSLLESKTKR